MALLATAYRRYELSLVYPVARGLAPVLALLIVVAAGGARPSTLGVVGVLAVAGGVLLVRGARGDLGGLVFGIVIASAIAGYTVVDRYGIRHAAAGPYLLLVMLGPALVYPLAVGRSRVRAAVSPATIVVGAASAAGVPARASRPAARQRAGGRCRAGVERRDRDRCGRGRAGTSASARRAWPVLPW